MSKDKKKTESINHQSFFCSEGGTRTLDLSIMSAAL